MLKKAIAVAVIVVGSFVAHPYLSVDTHRLEVSKTQLIEKGHYRIWTQEEHTMDLKDSWWFLNTTSSDMYGKILVGHTYDFEATGHRLGLISMFETIIDVEEVLDCKPHCK